jgi:hypothetical protein
VVRRPDGIVTLDVSKAVLVFVEPRAVPDLPPMLADLDDDEKEIINGYVNELGDRIGRDADASGWFQHGSDMPAKLSGLVACGDDQFLDIATALLTRLSESMRIATNPLPGLVVISRSRVIDAQQDSICTILKLDPKYDGARLIREARKGTRIRLQRFKDMLPRPGDLQKGLFWPDPRGAEISDVAIRDRNAVEARYFSNAYQVMLSAKPKDLAKALLTDINRLPHEADRQALRETVRAIGNAPATDVLERLQQVRPEFQPKSPALTTSRNRGIVHAGQFSGLPLEIDVDGIRIIIPQHKAERVETRRRGGAWEVVIDSPAQPRFADGTPADFTRRRPASGE